MKLKIITAILMLLVILPFGFADDQLNIKSATITKDVRDANWLEAIQCKYFGKSNCAEGEDGYLIIETPLETIKSMYVEEREIIVGEKAYFCAEVTWDYSTYINERNTCGGDMPSYLTANTGGYGCSVDPSSSYYMLYKQTNPNGESHATKTQFLTPHTFGQTWTVCSGFYPDKGTTYLSFPVLLTKNIDNNWKNNYLKYGAKYAYYKDVSATGIIAYSTQTFSVGVTATASKCTISCLPKCSGDYLNSYKCNPATGNCEYKSRTKCQYGCSDGKCKSAPNKCTFSCLPKCSGDYLNLYKCNPATGNCEYNSRTKCQYGCSDGKCNVKTSYCGDDVCDDDEDYITCPVDCESPIPDSYCGDDVCDDDENYDDCPCDCPNPDPPTGLCVGKTCPDKCSGDLLYSYECNPLNGLCEYKTHIECPAGCTDGKCDTTTPIEKCGDGVCSANESFLTCPDDCKASTTELNSIAIILIVGVFGIVWIIKQTKRGRRR